MKTRLLILFAVSAATFALRAEDTNSAPHPAMPGMPAAAPAALPAAAPATATATAPAAVDDATLSHQGYPASRYESLWTKSPFAVETPEENPTESAEYSLVGVAQLPGDSDHPQSVSYVSLIEKQNGNHLLLASDSPINGLSLTSITKKGKETFATLMRDGQPLTLKLEAAPVQSAGINSPMQGQVPSPAIMAPNIPMPGSGVQPSTRPMIHIHRPTIHVPSRQPDIAPALPPALPPGQPSPPRANP